MSKLNSDLIKKRKLLRRLTPSPANKQMDKLTSFLKNNNFETIAFNIGATIPEVSLLDHRGKKISLSSVLGNHPAIINFYRGSWCPYCNLELRAYSKILKENKLKGDKEIKMFSISPELPEITERKYDLKDLHFTVLSDINNHLAKKLHLVFQLPKHLVFIYRIFGINLMKSQKNRGNELPIPATYVIDKNRVITNAWIDADYTKRAEPQEVIDAYLQLL